MEEILGVVYEYGVHRAVAMYTQLAPRFHAAWTAFWYPGVNVIPGTSVGCVRVAAYGRVYGVYVPLDVPAWESGSHVDIVLQSSDGSDAWLDPVPLPGLRVRRPPSALGAVRAARVDPLEDAAEKFELDEPLP